MLKHIKHFKDRIVVIKKCSDEALNDIPDDLDFVYIDGNHNHPFVDNDIKNYYDKLKVGGLIGGHDFNYICPDVIEAVVDFSVKKNLKIFNYSSDWWFVK